MITQNVKRPFKPTSLLLHALLIAGALVFVGPFLWMVLTSLKTLSEATMVPPKWLPDNLRWNNYPDVISTLPFLQFYQNTVLMTAGRTIGQLIFCSMAAYAFARIEFPGRNVLFFAALATLMVPSHVFLIPQYLIMKDLGWINSLQALIVPGLFSTFGTFLMRQFFMTIPREYDESAKIDGANHFQIYFRIIVPLGKSGLVALAIITILWSWNDFMWPLIITNSPERMPLTAGLASLQGQYMTNYPLVMAGAVLAIWPMLVMFIFMQRQFVEGIALTGTKG